MQKNSKKYYLSIITVSYNNRLGLERTRDSILPLPNNCQWIIVDAASNDGTLEILQSLPKQDNILWVSEPDKGIFDGMNKGIGLAKGQYLNFMNSGDMFVRESFEKVIRDASHKADIFVFDYFPLTAKLHPAVSREFSLQNSKFNKDDVVPHQSSLIAKDVFKRIGNYDLDYKYTADYNFFVKAYYEGFKFNVDVNLKLAYFVQDGLSSGLNVALEQAREVKKTQIKYFGDYSRNIYFSQLLKFFLSKMPFSSFFYFKARNLFLNFKKGATEWQ